MHTFPQHGLFNTYLDGPLIVTEATGPWNKELVENWGKQAYPLAKQLKAQNLPHVGIAIIQKSLFCPPDALEALRAAVEFTVKRFECLAQVIVADKTVEGRDFLEPTYARVYAGLIEHRFFYAYDEAKAWSLELLRNHTPGQ